MSWLQIHFECDRAGATALERALSECGALSVTMRDSADQPILEPGLGETPLWDAVRVSGLFAADTDRDLTLVSLSAAYGNKLPRWQWETVEDRAWEREWMSDFKPLRCGSRLWICPTWCEPPAADAVNLLLDPGLAFGSGTHPTTFLCLQWLDRTDLSGKTVLDYGCGSGILGIAALLLGAEQLVAVDNDPQALAATRDNLARNGLDPARLTACFPDQVPDIGAEITLANILAEPLVELAPELTRLTADGGYLCLSGITPQQAESVQAPYRANFRFTDITEKDNWVRLIAVKADGTR